MEGCFGEEVEKSVRNEGKWVEMCERMELAGASLGEIWGKNCEGI